MAHGTSLVPLRNGLDTTSLHLILSLSFRFRFRLIHILGFRHVVDQFRSSKDFSYPVAFSYINFISKAPVFESCVSYTCLLP